MTKAYLCRRISSYFKIGLKCCHAGKSFRESRVLLHYCVSGHARVSMDSFISSYCCAYVRDEFWSY